MNTLLVRQPIFDDHERIAGYEVLCRDVLEMQREASFDCDADRVVVDAFLGVGLPRLAAGHRAYVSVSREMLLGNSIQLLAPDAIVVQVCPGEDPDDAFVNACERLVRAGYQVALDNFRLNTGTAPLLRHADIVKLDVQSRPRAELLADAKHIRNWPVKLLAEGVENRNDHLELKEQGFALFQGYLFSRPEAVSRRDLSVEHLRVLRLMTLVRDDAVSDHAITEAFRADVALSYKLLRMVNASAVGGKDLTSIAHAVGLLGRDALYRWLALLLIAPQGRGQLAAEIAHASLTRARFCELLADRADARLDGGLLFMVGLLAALDTFYHLPAVEIVEQLRLSSEATGALVERSGPTGAALALVIAFEEGKWQELEERCRAVGVLSADLTHVYLEALGWAHERVQVFNFDR